MDALHTQTKIATLICGNYQAHNVMTIKENQPSLYMQAQSRPWDLVPVGDLQINTSHGHLCTAS